MQVTAKQFEIWTSERSYRFKEDAFQNHAPQTPGIYQLVTFDEQQTPRVVYMALAEKESIFDALYAHFRGEREPTMEMLLSRYPNLYFSYVVDSNAQGPEDMKDLFWAMVQADKPIEPNPATVTNTGRYTEITVKDKSIL